jgi:hypothetical protein
MISYAMELFKCDRETAERIVELTVKEILPVVVSEVLAEKMSSLTTT